MKQICPIAKALPMPGGWCDLRSYRNVPFLCWPHLQRVTADFGSAICESDAFMPPPSDPAAPVELLASLTRAGVTFVIIGGQAVNFQGYVRTTKDTDRFSAN